MQSMSWRTVSKNIGLNGVLLWVGLSFYLSPISPRDFAASSLQAQDSPPQPRVDDSKTSATETNSTSPPANPQVKKGQPPATNTNPPAPAAVVQSQPAPRPAPKLAPRQLIMLKQTVAERQQVYRDAAESAAVSVRTSKESFDRGLMPLPDFAEQVSAALEIQLTIADLKGDRGERVKALSDHFDLLKTAAKQLQDFNQPAAQGWAADATYINLLASNSELRLAVARGDRSAYERAAERSSQLADEHFALRLADFQNGEASLSLLAKSASYLTTKTGLPEGTRDPAAGPKKYDEYLATLDDVVEQTQKFAQQGAGIGREDRLFQAQFELARATGQSALQRRRPEEAAVAFDQALNSATDWYASQLKFYQTGTASLREVTQSWWGRAELTDISERSGLIAEAEIQKAQDADFERLQKLVENTEDRQGRIAADIAYVKTLGSLESLWARQRAVQAMEAFKSPTAAKLPIPRRGSRVIEVNPQSGSTTGSKTIPGTTPTNTDKSKSSSIEIVTPKRAVDK